MSESKSDKIWAETAIKTNYLPTKGNWLTSVFFLGVLISAPIGFTLMCIDFLPEINLMNIFLCTVSASVVVYSSRRLFYYFTKSHKLRTIQTNLSSADNRKLAADIFRELNYSIHRDNPYFVEGGPASAFRAPTVFVTALFAEHVMYLHVQSILGGNENILLNKNSETLTKLVELITAKLTRSC